MSTNPFLARADKTNSFGKSHKRSRKQERELAQRVGGRVTARSGAGDEKGDCRLKRVVRIEAKTTQRKSFSVTLDMIAKIEEAAVLAGEMPVLVIEFTEEGKPIAEVAVCPTYVLESLVNE